MRGKTAKMIRRKLVNELAGHLTNKFPDIKFHIRRIKSPADLICISNEPKKRFEIFQQYKKYYRQTKKAWKQTPRDRKPQFGRHLRILTNVEKTT